MNTIEQPSGPCISLPEHSGEEQILKLRRRLKEVSRDVSLIQDVITVCVELSQGSSGDFNPEIANVLRRCAADRLRFQMTVLTNVIERLGDGNGLSKVEAATPGRTIK